MDSQLLSKAIEYVREFFDKDSSGHDFYHTMRVYKSAVMLAEKEGADVGLTALAALLHDVDDKKLSPDTHEGFENARSFMTANGIDETAQSKVIDIISKVSYTGDSSPVPESVEGKCVQDADRLDAMGAIGIARAFAFGGSRGRKMYDPEISPQDIGMDGNSTSLNHFYEKLFKLKGLMNTETARAIAQDRDRFMHSFVDEFLKEWDGEDC